MRHFFKVFLIFSMLMITSKSAFSTEIDSRIQQFKQKMELAQLLERFLGPSLIGYPDWKFFYLYGYTYSGNSRNLSLELATYDLPEANTASEQLAPEEFFDIYYNNSKYYSGGKYYNLAGNRIGLEITSTKFHHSSIMGTHPSRAVSFYVGFDEQYIVEEVRVDETTLYAKIVGGTTNAMELTITDSPTELTVSINNQDLSTFISLPEFDRIVIAKPLDYQMGPWKTETSSGL